MTAANPPGPPAYTQSPAINPTTLAQIVDPADNIVASVPIPDVTGPAYSAGGFQPSTTQLLVAILMELRVLNQLFQANSTTNLDLDSMRADVASGASGGLL